MLFVRSLAMENQRIKVANKDGITVVELLDEKIPKLDETVVKSFTAF